MKWYRGCYGSWRDPEGVKYIPGTSDRKKMFSEAHRIANEKQVVVVVYLENGMNDKIYRVKPEGVEEV